MAARSPGHWRPSLAASLACVAAALAIMPGTDAPAQTAAGEHCTLRLMPSEGTGLWLDLGRGPDGRAMLVPGPSSIGDASIVIGDTRVAARPLPLEGAPEGAPAGLPDAMAVAHHLDLTAKDADGQWISVRFDSIDRAEALAALRRACPGEAPDGPARRLAEQRMELDSATRRFARWALGQLTGEPDWPTGDGAFDVATRDRIERFTNAAGMAPSRFLSPEILERLKASTGFAIVPHFDLATNFYQDRAAVRLGDRWALIDTAGRIVHGPQRGETGPYDAGVMPFEQGGRWGIVTASGRVSHAPAWDRIAFCNDGVCGVERAGKWGFVDADGPVLVTPRFDRITAFRGGWGAAVEDGEWSLVDRSARKGRYRVSAKAVDWLFAPSDGLSTVVTRDGRRGFISTAGKLVVGLDYDRARAFSDGLAAVRDGDRWGFVNRGGSLEIPLRFGAAGDFSANRAPAEDASSGLWGFIDRKGNWVVDPRFSRLFTLQDGIAIARRPDPRRPGEFVRGFVDMQGEVLYPFVLEDAFRFNQGLAPVKLLGFWGYLDAALIEAIRR